MNTRTVLRILTLAILTTLLLPGSVSSSSSLPSPVLNEDVDLYLAGSNTSCNCSNVILFLDNASYWGNTYTQPNGVSTTKFATEIAALNTVISGLPDSMHLGLVMGINNGTDSSFPAPNTNGKALGGVIRYAVRPMTTTNKANLLTLLNGLDRNLDQASPNPAYALTFHTIYDYLEGNALYKTSAWTPPSGNLCGKPAGTLGPCTSSVYTAKTSGSSYFPPYSSGGNASDPVPTGQVRSDNGTLRYASGQQLAMGDTGAYIGGTPHVFKSPLTSDCQKTYIIMISNGFTDATEDNNSGGSPTAFNANDQLVYDGGNNILGSLALVKNVTTDSWVNPATGVADGTKYSGSTAPATSLLSAYARYLYGTDVNRSLAGQQTVITYTINPWPNSPVNQDYDMEMLLEVTAAAGHGKYFRVNDTITLVQSLNQIFSEVQAVNSVFAAAAVPVSANTQGTNLNQVYLGLFRPDANMNPRWYGNLKMYQAAVNSSSNTLFLADVNGTAADNPTTGFITSSATSYWTTASSFWNYAAAPADPNGHSFGDTGYQQSDLPDGQVVERGAAAGQLRTTYATSQTARDLYTCTGSCAAGSALSTTPFATSNSALTPAALGVVPTTDTTTANAIVNWVRGADNGASTEKPGDTSTSIRPSVHGDVLHSKPALVNYNRNGDNNDVYAFYGGNDGVFHAVQGGMGSSGGSEVWGFVPSEFFTKLSVLRNNNPIISASSKKPYFFDGAITSYIVDANHDKKIVATDGDLAYLYLTAHRGGKLVYALDASDPESPKFLWKVSNTTTGFSELGQTWSTVSIAKIRGNTNPVAIFGGGYDNTHEDGDPATTDTSGRAIYVVDAYTGALLWEAGPNPSGAATNLTVTTMTNSIASEISAYDSDKDGFVDRLYAGDTGGHVWRVDIDNATPLNWTVTQLASIAGSGAANQRKFLFPPDVVYNGDQNGTFDAVLIGTGDREHPFNTTVVNRFYMFKDAHAKTEPANFVTITENSGNGGSGGLYDVTANLVQTGTAAQQVTAKAALAAASGWFLTFGNAGEKDVGGAITLAGTVVFNTYYPTAGDPATCTNGLGVATQYLVSYANAASTVNLSAGSGLDTADRTWTVPGGGFVPSPVPVVIDTGNGVVAGVLSGTQFTTLPTSLGPRTRSYWQKLIDQ